ncbi:MAG: bifunctional riboflavin kinase/FAD synthetase [Chloroflexi bacterium]|nr:bifunctional riboflavin kinase/FAD synthetase [Chloroflexota bacterium]
MHVIQNLFTYRYQGKTTVTIGNFDGVHLGHQHLIRHVVEDARAHGRVPAVVTFQPHPRLVLHPGERMAYISSWEERLALLEAVGVEVVAVVRFNLQVAQMAARTFTQELVSRLGMESLWVGPDFALGRNREGTVDRLRELGQEQGFSVHVVPPFLLDGEPVRSNYIRELVGEKGDVRRAARLLGRYFTLSGIVIHGDGRGAQLGVPTANLAFAPNRLIPANGVYATWVYLNGERWPGATNVGYRPTVAGSNPTRTVETHIIGLQRNLYYRALRLEFVERLREERRFDSVSALKAQIREDVAEAARILALEGCCDEETSSL